MLKTNPVLVYEGGVVRDARYRPRISTGRVLRWIRASRHDRRSAWRVAATIHQQPKESTVAKGMEQKKETKKKPAKTMKEKKAEKNAKKASK